ncbi:hypothetical protein ACE6H2_025273 [Prunus campanulata]
MTHVFASIHYQFCFFCCCLCVLPSFSAPSVVHCFVAVVVPVDKAGGVWLFLLLLVSVNNVFQTCKRG